MSVAVSAASSAAVVSPAVFSDRSANTANSSGAVSAGSATGVSKTTTSSQAQQQAALNQLLAKYKASLARGQTADDLANLARQITAAAKALGQHVTLPKASAEANAQAPSQSLYQPQSATGEKLVNLTA